MLIYRFLNKPHSKHKDTVEEITFKRIKQYYNCILWYDTLYYEASDEDDFRKIGFSKNGKFQNPYIMLGLLVGEKGCPIWYELLIGNTFEGHTLTPILKSFQKKFNLVKPIIVADSELLSNQNIEDLKLNSDKNSDEIAKSNQDRLIISYSNKRAKKDKHNRKKGLLRLEKKIR